MVFSFRNKCLKTNHIVYLHRDFFFFFQILHRDSYPYNRDYTCTRKPALNPHRWRYFRIYYSNSRQYLSRIYRRWIRVGTRNCKFHCIIRMYIGNIDLSFRARTWICLLLTIYKIRRYGKDSHNKRRSCVRTICRGSLADNRRWTFFLLLAGTRHRSCMATWRKDCTWIGFHFGLVLK